MLSLSAYGEAKIAPDTATIIGGVGTTATTATEAMHLNREKMTAAVAALKRLGVDQKDIQTSGLELSPVYRPNTYGDNREVIGYRASNEVRIVTGDMAGVGRLIDAFIAAGANDIGSVAFGVRDNKDAQDAARREAVRSLREKAELYAAAAGLRITALRNLSESGSFSPEPRFRALATNVVGFNAAADTPIEPGQLTVRIDVHGVYIMQ